MNDEELKAIFGFVPSFDISDEEWEAMLKRNEMSIDIEKTKKGNENDTNS
jgi:hypothetical protein